MRRRVETVPVNLIRLASSRVAGYPAVILAVAATSWVVGDLQAQTRIYDASILYLLVIVGGAIAYGLGPAVVAAVVGLGMFDWFLDPVGTPIPDGPAEYLSLGLFVFVGIVTSKLAANQRQRADEAREREREALALYALNSLLISTTNLDEFLAETLHVFGRRLEIEGIALFTTDGTAPLVQRSAVGNLRPETAAERQLARDILISDHRAFHLPRRRVSSPRQDRRAASGSSVDAVFGDRSGSLYAVVRADEMSVGVLRISRPTNASELDLPQRRFLGAIGQHAGISLERARMQQVAAEAAALRKAEEVKNAVLDSVTHDLRTPLAMIKAAADNLLAESIDWSEEEKDSFARSIAKNANQLDTIVGNLLELSRIDAGMISPERQIYPLVAIVEDVVNRLTPILAGHPVTIDVSDDLPPVPVDYVAIDRVLSNLLENVAHHTPAGTAVVISAILEANQIRVSVADNGPGIPLAVLPRVFERFQKGRLSHPDSRRGSGFGLAVVKGLVEAHGGQSWVESHYGRGSTFFFTLPLATSRPMVQTTTSRP